MATRSTSSASLLAALLVFCMLGATVLAAAPAEPEVVVSAAPAPASRLLVGEVVTGGTSASDEFVEIYHAGIESYDLTGVDVAYVTVSGATVSVKASWSGSLVMVPGQHLLLANAAGVFATLADATFSGGLSSTGGTIAVRAGGTVLDSLSWGNATSGYVEGTPAVAPPAYWSVERAPGGLAGNGTDTGDNSADAFLQPVPIAQGLSAPPVPEPTPSPPATSSPSPSPTDSPVATPAPTSTSTDPVQPTPTPIPTATPSPTPTPTSTPTPSPIPTPTPTPTRTPSPSPTPPVTPSPTPAPASIAVARLLPSGSRVRVAGWLTTPGGFTETGHGAFLQDATAGIAIYLTGTWPALATGDGLTVTGSVETRYGQTTIKVPSPADLVAGGPPGDPQPVETATGAAGEPLEGSLVDVRAEVISSPSALTDGFSVDVDDGTGPVRVVIATATSIASDGLPRHARVRVTGVLGQRQSGSAAGFRIHVRTAADVEILAPPPTPTPPPTPSPTPRPSPTPTPRPTTTASHTPTPRPSDPTPTPSATPTPTPATITIAAARGHSIGDDVTVAGVVTAEPGRVLSERTFVIQDASGGVAVGVPSGTVMPSRGDAVVVHGELVAPYGNLEVRASHPDDLRKIGQATIPAPVAVTSDRLTEALEGRLARLDGVVTSIDASSSGSLTLILEDGQGEAKIFAFESAGLDPDRFERGQRLRVTGVAGQRASGAGRPDGYRLWPRDPGDVAILAQPTPSPTATPTGGATPTPRPSTGSSPTPGSSGPPGTAITIAAARSRPGQEVTIAGTVTTPTGILDSDGRRVTVEDATAAILVRLETGGPAVTVGDRIRVTGEVGTYYGAMQLAAGGVATVTGHGTAPPPATHATGALAATSEWRLVRISGTVDTVTRDGDGWRAEIVLADGTRVPVIALPRAGIPVTAVTKGATAGVTGVVRPPYPTASDRRSAVLPRSARDITSGHAPASSASPGSSGSTDDPAGSPGTSPGATAGGDGSAGPGTTRGDSATVQLARLPEFLGQRVRVGGTVVVVDGTRVRLRDASGEGTLRFGPSLAPLAATLSGGETINATGEVVREADGTVVLAVEAAEDLQRAGSLDSAPASGDATGGSPGTNAAAGAGTAGSTGTPPGTPSSRAGEGNVTLLAVGSLGMLGLTLLAVGVWPAFRRRLVVARPLARRLAERLGRRSNAADDSAPPSPETAAQPADADPAPATLAALPPPN